MRVAVSTEGGQVAQHFGRCPEYTIVEIEGDKIVSKEVIPNPGHQPGFLPGYLASNGVNVIIAGGMGPRAQGLFAQHNIQTILGVSGPVDQVIDDFLQGKLEGGESLCDRERHGRCEQ